MIDLMAFAENVIGKKFYGVQKNIDNGNMYRDIHTGKMVKVVPGRYTIYTGCVEEFVDGSMGIFMVMHNPKNKKNPKVCLLIEDEFKVTPDDDTNIDDVSDNDDVTKEPA